MKEPIKSLFLITPASAEVEILFKEFAPAVSIFFAKGFKKTTQVIKDVKPDGVFSVSMSDNFVDVNKFAVNFESVRWFHIGGSGYNHILPWDDKKVVVTNAQGTLAPFLAETVIAGIMYLNNGLFKYITHQRNRVWKPETFRSIQGKTLLIVGMGSIGSEVAKRAKLLGMRVLGIRRKVTPHPFADATYPPEKLGDILPEADVVSLHLRLDSTTHKIFDELCFSKMKKGSFFINTGRGKLVDETALIDALSMGHLAGAYLDVFSVEPLPQTSLLWQMKNVLVTPHASDLVEDWILRLTMQCIDNLEAWNKGEALMNQVFSSSDIA